MSTLESILREPYSEIVRDATIQRFEYSFEACWKALKQHLSEREGIVCNSPKSCFRSAFQVGLLDETRVEQALLMSNQRNLTSHTYVESVAQLVYEHAAESARLMRDLLKAMSVPPEDPH